jgi:hypothetical protein
MREELLMKKSVEIKTNYPFGSYYVNLEKANGQEAFILQTFGFFPAILMFGLLRMDEIIECSDEDQLFKYDRFAFFTDELRKKAFENILGQEINTPPTIARILNRINKYEKKTFNWYFDTIVHEK